MNEKKSFIRLTMSLCVNCAISPAFSDLAGRKVAIIVGGVLYAVGGTLQTAAVFLWLVSVLLCGHFWNSCPLLLSLCPYKDDVLGQIYWRSRCWVSMDYVWIVHSVFCMHISGFCHVYYNRILFAYTICVAFSTWCYLCTLLRFRQRSWEEGSCHSISLPWLQDYW